LLLRPLSFFPAELLPVSGPPLPGFSQRFLIRRGEGACDAHANMSDGGGLFAATEAIEPPREKRLLAHALQAKGAAPLRAWPAASRIIAGSLPDNKFTAHFLSAVYLPPPSLVAVSPALGKWQDCSFHSKNTVAYWRRTEEVVIVNYRGRNSGGLGGARSVRRAAFLDPWIRFVHRLDTL
jgi:hypothetical protein